MDIETAPLAGSGHGVQHPLGQDESVSHDHHGLGIGLGDQRLRGLRLVGKFSVQAQTGRLRQG